MKRIGYKPEIAGAIEACASCGGPLMPPIMGAGAFIMAELTGVPYSRIIVAAALPAVLYYVGIMATVHWEAIKQRIGTMTAEVPSLTTLLRRALLFMPFVIVVYFLEVGYSPSKAALYSLLSAVVVSWFAGEQPMTPRRIFDTMTEAMRSGVIVATVLAASGLIVASMSRTGFALAFSSTIINLSGGYLIIALVLIFAVVSVLGTGIPTTPSYILAVTVGGAALQRLGVDILAAHLFVFYYAVLADVTPPVAVTAFAGAQMAGSDPMRTGWQASRIAISGFLAQFLFVYQPALLMEGSLPEIVMLFASAVVGISALSAAAAGYMFRKLGWPQRALLIAVSLAAISPPPAVSGATSLALVAFGAWGWSRPRREGARPGSVAPPGRCGLARCPRRGAQGLRVQRRAPTSGLPASVAVGDVPLRVHAPQRLRLGEATPEEACEDESAQAGSLPRARDQHAHAQGQVGCHRRFSWSASRKGRIFRRLRPADPTADRHVWPSHDSARQDPVQDRPGSYRSLLSRARVVAADSGIHRT